MNRLHELFDDTAVYPPNATNRWIIGTLEALADIGAKELRDGVETRTNVFFHN